MGSSLISFLFSESTLAAGAREKMYDLFASIAEEAPSSIAQWMEQTTWESDDLRGSMPESIRAMIEILTCQNMSLILENRTEEEYSNFIHQFFSYFWRVENLQNAITHLERILFFLDDIFGLEKRAKESIQFQEQLFNILLFLLPCEAIHSFLNEHGQPTELLPIDAWAPAQAPLYYMAILKKLSESENLSEFEINLFRESRPEVIQWIYLFYHQHLKKPGDFLHLERLRSIMMSAIKGSVNRGHRDKPAQEISLLTQFSLDDLQPFAQDIFCDGSLLAILKIIDFTNNHLRAISSLEKRIFLRNGMRIPFSIFNELVKKNSRALEFQLPTLWNYLDHLFENHVRGEITWSNDPHDYYFLTIPWASTIERIKSFSPPLILRPEHFSEMREDLKNDHLFDSNHPLRRFVAWWVPLSQNSKLATKENRALLKEITECEAMDRLNELEQAVNPEAEIKNIIDAFPQSILVSPIFHELLKEIWKNQKRNVKLALDFIKQSTSTYPRVTRLLDADHEYDQVQRSLSAIEELQTENDKPLPLLVLNCFLQEDSRLKLLSAQEDLGIRKLDPDLLSKLNALPPFIKAKIILLLEKFHERSPEHIPIFLDFAIEAASLPNLFFACWAFLVSLWLERVEDFPSLIELLKDQACLDGLITHLLTHFPTQFDEVLDQSIILAPLASRQNPHLSPLIDAVAQFLMFFRDLYLLEKLTPQNVDFLLETLLTHPSAADEIIQAFNRFLVVMKDQEEPARPRPR